MHSFRRLDHLIMILTIVNYILDQKPMLLSDGKPSGDIISLGEHESDFDWSDDQKVKAKMFKKKRVQKYHTQYYVNGTQCQVINHKRDTEVRVCFSTFFDFG